MAGMGTRDIKRKIKSVNNTKQITKAMELVSTAKLRRAKDKVETTKPYFETVMNTVKEIVQSETSLRHDYLEMREVNKSLYIVITADRGLCGGYNINALKKAAGDIEDASKAKFITIGKKAMNFFRKEEADIVKEYLYISEKPAYSDAQEIAGLALKMFESGEVDEIKLIYTRLVSTISQVPEILKLLPADVEGEAPELTEDAEFTTYEPSAEVVLNYLIPKYLESTIYGALIDSAASEQAARRVAMENASNNAEDMISSLTLTYNQARQAAITQEISEIVGGAEALS